MQAQSITRKPALLGCVLAATLLLGACATGPVVQVEIDQKADFTQYKTFGFANPLGTDRNGYQTIVSGHLKAATQRELEARGLRLNDNAPQLLVNFNAELNEKLRVSSLPSPMLGFGMGRGYYGYRSGMYATWPMYRGELVATPYQEGALNIDLIDASSKQMVWEGVVTEAVTQKALDN
ncbi:DUF4136 domain-containing protein, partial [Roseateles sp. GG27B]